jgi:hypothetical protein
VTNKRGCRFWSSAGTMQNITLGNGCDGWHLVRESGLSVIEECMPGCASDVAHYHRNSRQFFFILAEQAVVETDGRRISLFAAKAYRSRLADFIVSAMSPMSPCVFWWSRNRQVVEIA